ncbi:MAG: glycosyltransferase family 2 protein, partial [Candidatus Saccharibacteria bacterium]|nr:glycosyltransferase family 2 protein [Candidatus Saccharibacteria bacterium]
MAKISALVISHNSEQTLAACLKSVAFADEVVVVDLASSDASTSIARSQNAKVIERAPVSHVELIRNETIAATKHEWVILLDADEELSEGAAKTCRAIAEKPRSESAAAYQLPRKHLVFNKWLKHSGWWPDYQTRFFQRDAVQWSGKINEPPVVQGELKRFEFQEAQAIVHHHYYSLDDYLDRLRRYTAAEVTSKQQVTPTPDHIFQAFFADFFRRYYQDDGWRDGQHGLVMAMMQGMYQSVVQMRAWESAGFPESRK